MTEEDQPAFDPSVVVSAVSAFLLGDLPSLNRAQVADLAGVPLEVATERWRALGFPEVGDDTVVFTPADVEALQLTQRLVDMGFFPAGSEQAFIRTTGRTFARLAEWQAQAMLAAIIDSEHDESASLEILEEIVPIGQSVQSYIWRRHLVSAANRLLLDESIDTESAPMCVGFADIVGYTARSREMSSEDLAAMVERFEQVVTGLITDHHGRVIKTIGDEVLFVTDNPREAAHLALELLEQHTLDETFPSVRIGMAYGNVLSRLGDVYGPVVNVASRLTSVAKPARAVIDRAMAEHLREDKELRIRRMRRTSVKGYEHLEPWSLKRPRDEDDPKPGLRDAIEERLEDAVAQLDDATDAARAAMEAAAERPGRKRSAAVARTGEGKRRTDKRRKTRRAD